MDEGQNWGAFFQDLTKQALSAKWDAEYLQAYRASPDVYGIKGVNGPTVPAGTQSMRVGGVALSPVLLLAGAVGVGLLILVIVKD